MNPKLTGILTAGGKSSRMNQNKALIEFNGKKLIEYSFDILSKLCDEILISSNSNEYAFLSKNINPDIYKEIGPLGGIFSCLQHSQNEKCLILPCDTPFIKTELLEYLLKFSKDFETVIPEINGKIEPLIGIYSKSSIPILEKQIKEKEYSLYQTIIKTKYKFIEINPNLDFYTDTLFYNINSQNDLEKAQHSKF
jgi:molybdopterin-guanine dinucleotide biosynthesis protein A